MENGLKPKPDSVPKGITPLPIPSSQRQRRIGATMVTRRPPLTLDSSERFKRVISDPGPPPLVPSPCEKPKDDTDPHFDISGQTSENRYPWVRDVATQCQFSDEEMLSPTFHPGSVAPRSPMATRWGRTNRSQSTNAM